MPSGAAIVELYGNPKGEPISYTCGSAQAFTKGDLLWLTDPMTVSGVATAGAPFAGIAAEDKSASETSKTKISCYTKGIFDLYNGDAPLTCGDYVRISGINTIYPATGWVLGTLSAAYIVGKSMETGSASEVVKVKLGF
jgi:hypothetical protein